MARAVHVATTFAVSWNSPDRRTGGNTKDRARQADSHDLRVAEPFCAGRCKLCVLAVGHFVRAPVTVATGVRGRVSRGLQPVRELAPPPVVLQRFMEENVPFDHRHRSGDELNPREQASLRALKRLAVMHDEQHQEQENKTSNKSTITATALAYRVLVEGWEGTYTLPHWQKNLFGIIALQCVTESAK